MARDTIVADPYDTRSLGLSDLMLAHVLQRSERGGPFDVGGVVAVPRVDSEIAGGKVNLYFEVYPGEDVLRRRQSLYVTYRVQSRPPRNWRFRDQFSAEKRARRSRRTAVESTFMLEPRRAVEQQDLTIDVATLEPGDYALTVEVQRYGDTRRLARSVDFWIPERQRPQP
jgi:hypothetical protein